MISPEDLKLKRAVQLLCTTGIRRPLTMERVRTWLKQFAVGPEQTLALLVLRFLIYRTSDQIQSVLTQALRKTALHFTEDLDEKENVKWRDILTGKTNLDFLFGPPAHEYTKPGKSGELIVRLLKLIFAIESRNIQYPSMVTNLDSNERYIMIDDGVFTGEQLTSLIASFDAMRITPRQTGIVVAIAHERGLNALQSQFPNIPVFFGEKITKEDSLEAHSQRWVDDGRWPYQDCSPLQVYLDVASVKGNFRVKQPLGYGGLGLMVAYEHGIPDDSLQLLWDQSETWNPLIDR